MMTREREILIGDFKNEFHIYMWTFFWLKKPYFYILVFFGFFFGGQTLKKKLERALHVFGHLSSLAALLSQEIGERPHTHREREERESDRIRHIKLSRAKAFVAEAERERERECTYSITRYKNHGDAGIRATSAESRVVLLLLGVLLVEFILLFSKEKDFDYDHAFVVPGRKSNRVVVVVVVFIFFFFFFFFSRKESQSESCERVQAFESDS